METSALLKQQIAKEIGLSQKHVESVIRLLEDGNTVPFIARYRKEQTVQWMRFRFRRFLNAGNTYKT